MIILSGKSSKEINKTELDALTSGYKRISIDIGTGDGRNIYRKAKADPETFYIGVDPVKDNMEEIAVKMAKKPEKGGTKNALLCVATAENLPGELYGVADEVTVLFPWGVLLEGVIKPVEAFITGIKKSARSGSVFEFITTYGNAFEENMIESRSMPTLSKEYFDGEYRKTLEELGFIINGIETLNNEYVKSFDSKWARKLAFGRKRDFYRITGTIL